MQFNIYFAGVKSRKLTEEQGEEDQKQKGKTRNQRPKNRKQNYDDIGNGAVSYRDGMIGIVAWVVTALAVMLGGGAF